MAKKMDELSLDALNAISDFVDGYGLAKLWMIGSKSLHNKLRRAITTFQLIYESRERLHWPKVISCFSSLEHFYIGTNDHELPPYITGVHLQDIPSSVRSIELNFANGLLSLLSPPSTIRPVYSDGLSMIDLSIMFPRLENITWKNGYADLRHYEMGNFGNQLVRLPLTELDLCNLSSIPLMPTLKLLPHSLLTLKLELHHLGEEIIDFPNFPPHLTSLHIIFSLSESQDNVVKIINNLPQTLGTLEMTLNLPDMKISWPPTLTSLVLHSQSSRWNTKMSEEVPGTLTSLCFKGESFDPASIRKLPPSLTSLGFMQIRSFSFASNKIESPNQADLAHLTSLKFISPNFFPINGMDPFIPFLPKSLEGFVSEDAFTRSEFYVQSNEFISSLPNALRKLRLECSLREPLPCAHLRALYFVDSSESGTIRNFEDFKHLASLKQLEVLSVYFHYDPPSAKWLDVLECQLTTLSGGFGLDYINFSAPWAKQLRSFELLHIPAPNMKAHSLNFFKNLPSTLTKLDLIASHFLYNRREPSFPEFALTMLPPKLETLQIFLDELSGIVFDQLPNTLKRLTLSGIDGEGVSPTWTLTHLHALPKSICSLIIPSSSKIRSTALLNQFVTQRPSLMNLITQGKSEDIYRAMIANRNIKSTSLTMALSTHVFQTAITRTYEELDASLPKPAFRKRKYR
jgi:hypothetical protein